jgi:alkylation response protein AidB-like acyl-CoA dehydrogenase
MSDERSILIETAARVFQDRYTADVRTAVEQGDWPAEVWQTLEETGLTLASIPENAGGSGGSLTDAAAILRVAGRHAVSLPLAETLLAGWLLSSCGQAVPDSPLTVAPVRADEQIAFRRDGQGWVLGGAAGRVPWARHATHLVVVGRATDGLVGLVPAGACRITPGRNLAGEPRDDVAFDGVRLQGEMVVPAAAGLDEATLVTWGALLRAVQMAGALERVLELAVTYATERTQFGRPIGRFQAIQHHLAVLAGEVAAAGAAVDAAVAAAEAGDATAEVAAAKIRVGEAAGAAAAIAHQVHGAIGFTYEHALHNSTRRLWAWREEFGKESAWAARLGHMIAARGPRTLWAFISGAPPLGA